MYHVFINIFDHSNEIPVETENVQEPENSQEEVEEETNEVVEYKLPEDITI